MTHTNRKAIKGAYAQYTKTNATHLFQVYGRCSKAKENAFRYCEKLMNTYGATKNGHILSYNTFAFTFGFIGEINGKEAFFWITRDYDRYIYLDELGVA